MHPTHGITRRSLPPAVLASYAGFYELQPGTNTVITVKDGQLVSQLGPQPKVPLYAKSEGNLQSR